MTIEFKEHHDTTRAYLAARNVAKRLGVSTQLITGLVHGGQIEGYAVSGKSGQRVVFVYSDQVARLEALMAGDQ